MAALGSAVLVLGGGASSAVAADGCSNAEFRVGPSALLPDCRAYELVSPADKGAYTLTTANATTYPSLSGDQVFFGVITPFADPLNGSGGKYVARRGETGWSTRWMTPRFCKADQSGQIGGFASEWFSRDFSIALLRDPGDSNCDPDDHAGADLYRYDPDGSFTWLSHNGEPKTVDVQMAFVGASDDAGHVIFTTSEKLVSPFDDGRMVGFGMYDRVGEVVKPVAVANDGSPINACGAGVASGGGEGRVSGDGRVIFFTSGSSTSVPGCSAVTDDGGQLYARVDHAQTVMISASVRSTPDTRRTPTFSRATRDGRKVLFRSSERLTDDATVNGGWYQYDLSPVLDGTASTGTLRFLSPSLDGSNAGVTNSNQMSAEGSTVYFSATGVLVPGAPASGTKVYRWHDGDLTLVASSSPGEYTTSVDGTKLAYLAPPSGSSFAQVHLYDADDGSTTCVSCPPGGAVPSGAAKLAEGGDRPPVIGVSRHVTDDGRVFFSSLDQLVSRDTNAKHDVYEYYQGRQRLLSSGTSGEDSWYAGADDDGRTVFIATHASLLPEDFDNGDQDLYAVRIGGGFPQPEGSGETCAGDACQGGVAAVPGVLFPGTAGYVGAGNIPAPQGTKGVPTTKLSLVKGRRTARGTTGHVRVRVSGAGTVRTSGSGLRRSNRTVKRSGATYRVPVRLSSRAKRTLNRRGRVQVRVTLRFTPTEGKSRSKRVRMTFRRPKKKPSSRARSGERTVSARPAADRKGRR